MKIIGLLMFRNEERILNDTLDHMAGFCDDVIVYDDASTDGSYSICENHPIVKRHIRNYKWDPDREHAENRNRNILLKLALENADPNDWFVYMDADERIEFDWEYFRSFCLRFDTIDAVRMKLFDFYITSEDVELNYSDRKWCGPEYREIIFAFRASASKKGFPYPYQREPSLPGNCTVLEAGYVKHYGKGLSVEDWEKKCDFYSKFAPRYAAKWEKRKGKAVHTVSSFGMPLITWEEKDKKGILLTPEIEKHSIY